MRETGLRTNHNPLVSVIIPLYNAENYIGETIQNILNQTYYPIEIIIIDDGSTDTSLSIAKSYEGKKVKVFSQTNKGASAARNYGLKEAEGDFIQFLDADDLLSANKIEEQVKLLINHPSKIVSSFTVHFFDSTEIGNEQSEINHPFLFDSDIPADFLLNLYGGNGDGGMITIHSWLTPMKIIEKAGFWNEELSVDDDGEFFCRVILASDGVIYETKGINYYRKYRNNRNLSAQTNYKAMKSCLNALLLKQKHFEFYANDSRYKDAFARSHTRLALQSYPQFKDIVSICFDNIKQLGGSKYDVTIGGPKIEYIKRIFGWKLARLFQHYFQNINN